MPPADDDSLSWGGDTNDSSYLDGARGADRATDSRPVQPASDPAAAARNNASAGAAREADPREADHREPGSAAIAPSGISSVLLVIYGVLAGINIFFVFGWVLAFQRETFAPDNPFLDFMYQLGHILAIAAPVVYFGTVLWLTRRSRPIVRLGWLLLGILLLAPWPFILSGAVR